MSAPKANPENLLSIIRQAHEAKVVLPEFQRSFLWARTDIEELLVSLLQEYFIGTFLIVDTQSDKPMFPYRPVEGIEHINRSASPKNHATVRLILDGQQRISSLYYALYEPNMALSSTVYPYRFFLRLDKALNGELDDSVVGVSTRDRRRLSDIQRLVTENKALSFSLLRDSERFYPWLYEQQKVWQEAKREQLQTLYKRFTDFMIPVVDLPQETPKDSIVNIFERINRTGINLSLFDLAVARLYIKDVKLRDLLDTFEKEAPDVAQIVKPDSLLRIIAVLEGKEPRRSNLLDVIDDLDSATFSSRWDDATKAIVKAHERITKHYGAFDTRWLPYTTMYVPLAVMLYQVQQRKGGESEYRKIDHWYWTTVFTQRYDSAVDSQTFADVRDLNNWIMKDTPPRWGQVRASDLMLDTEEQRSAVYKGLMCLVAASGAKDFLTGQPADLNQCEDEHIFPRAVYKAKFPVNTILNRTQISDVSNKAKSDKKPSDFIKLCIAQHGGDEAKFMKTLESHLITLAAYEAMQADDFDAFIEARRQAFITQIDQILQNT